MADEFALTERAAELANEVIAAASARTQQTAFQDQLANYVRQCWVSARDFRQSSGVEMRMQQSLRQRKGEYDPEKLAEIRRAGGSEIYMMITSVKCRAASAWLRDALSGSGNEKPWTITPTPVPSLPPDAEAGIRSRISYEVGSAIAQGLYPTPEQVQERMEGAKRQIVNLLNEKARLDAEATEARMEDVLDEGGWRESFDALVDDLVTFPAAIIAGPLQRRRPVLEWVQGPEGGWGTNVRYDIREEFERVSPFDFYPDPNSATIEDGFVIRRHRLTVQALTELKGAPGYDPARIDQVLDEHGRGGLHEWMTIDQRTGQPDTQHLQQAADWTKPIDAIEFWGAVPGRALKEWGMAGVTEDNQVYQATVWLIGRQVISALLNPDPLGRKPFAKACYEDVPGSFWGNSVPDLIRDVQQVCNAAARALVNNMGMASGPQVWVNIDRLPADEKVTGLYPWKLWQTTSDEMGTTSPPIDFFQPNSNANELMAVYEKFSILADEYSGIPRYMAGDEHIGGAGRTASGLSMLMGNANKMMKHVVANVDRLLDSVLQRLHLYMLHVKKDPAIRGDLNIVVRGALAVQVKDTMQIRRQELLVNTANPIDMTIIGPEGRAELWRENIKGLGINPDKVVPPPDVLRERLQRVAAMQLGMARPGQPGQPGQPGSAPPQGQPNQPGAPRPPDAGPVAR